MTCAEKERFFRAIKVHSFLDELKEFEIRTRYSVANSFTFEFIFLDQVRHAMRHAISHTMI